MALTTVEGVYREGRVELLERPTGVEGATHVLVTFLPAELAEAMDKQARARAEARREAGERLFETLKQGIGFGGPPYPKREELYDRHDRREE